MSRYPKNEAIRSNLLDHPAVRAWSRTQSQFAGPQRIEVLKRQDGDRHKSAVYRLVGVTKMGDSMIAKRCLRATWRTERIVYEEILPRIPIPTLQCYGSIEEPDSEFCWLFLEDTGGQEYSPMVEDHRLLATCLIAQIHTSSSDLLPLEHLPMRGPLHYKNHLDSARWKIEQSLDNPVLRSQDLRLLESILTHFSIIEAHWGQVEELSGQIPDTLVHGDFKPKNIHVRSTNHGLELFLLDWEMAGQGTPVRDLRGLNIDLYYSIAKAKWPYLTLSLMHELTSLGTLLWCLAAIDWDSGRLRFDWVDRAMKRIAKYESQLSNVIQNAQWRT